MNTVTPAATSFQAALDFDIPRAAYVHIPFCRRRCHYCDFPIAVVGDQRRGETAGPIAQYVDILCQEIKITAGFPQPLRTIFLGGGTPSLLSVAQLAQILQTLEQRFGLAADVEISLEIDPGTFTLGQLQGYQAAGVNRVSLGAQAFQPHLLAACGRSHTVAEIYRAVELIQQAQLSNFNLDLISGLPTQTLEQWQASLEAAIALSPTHLSTYDLTLEPGTAFGRRYQPGCSPLPTEETTAQMYRLAGQILPAAGYEHYEISNYGRRGYQCRHNRVYWENQPYYGFGMGAASYTHQQRFTRPQPRSAYFAWVQALRDAGGVIDQPHQTPTDLLLETLMLGLRLAEGLSVTALEHQFGAATVQQILDCLAPYQARGWVDLSPSPASDRRIRLQDPEGFLVSNVILVELWTVLEPN